MEASFTPLAGPTMCARRGRGRGGEGRGREVQDLGSTSGAVPRIHTRIWSQCPWQGCRYERYLVSTGVHRPPSRPHPRWVGSGRRSHRLRSVPIRPRVESPSIAYTLQNVPGKERCTTCGLPPACTEYRAQILFPHVKFPFPVRQDRQRSQLVEKSLHRHPSTDGSGQRWPEDEARTRREVCDSRVERERPSYLAGRGKVLRMHEYATEYALLTRNAFIGRFCPSVVQCVLEHLPSQASQAVLVAFLGHNDSHQTLA